MAKREISDAALRKLLDSHAKIAARDKAAVESKAKIIASGKRILDGWGPTLMVMGAACVMSAPALAGLAWTFTGLAGGMLAAAGNVLLATGLAGTCKSVVYEVIEQDHEKEVLLLEDKSSKIDIEELELIFEAEEED